MITRLEERLANLARICTYGEYTDIIENGKLSDEYRVHVGSIPTLSTTDGLYGKKTLKCEIRRSWLIRPFLFTIKKYSISRLLEKTLYLYKKKVIQSSQIKALKSSKKKFSK